MDDSKRSELDSAMVVIEKNALADLFDHVRECSADGRLAKPYQWAEIGLVPDHMTPEEFEMFAYEYLEDAAARAAERDDSDARASGDAGADDVEPDDACADRNVVANAADAASSDGEDDGLRLPDGYDLVELDGEWVLMPVEESPEGEEQPSIPEEKPIRCENVKALVGVYSYYLYDASIMTDNYAHWAYLAAEDNPVITFVDCVREESRVYPRPMAAVNLSNAPFEMSEREVEGVWSAVSESGDYPDICRAEASNGDVYYYSTDYLSPARAEALVEWDAVERYFNV